LLAWERLLKKKKKKKKEGGVPLEKGKKEARGRERS